MGATTGALLVLVTVLLLDVLHPEHIKVSINIKRGSHLLFCIVLLVVKQVDVFSRAFSIALRKGVCHSSKDVFCDEEIWEAGY